MANETPYEGYMDKNKDAASEAPFLGQQTSRQVPGVTANGTAVRYFVGTLTNENDVLMLEDLMTRSMKCRDRLDNVGDVLMINEQGTFDKEGCYHIVVKYLELIEEPDDKK